MSTFAPPHQLSCEYVTNPLGLGAQQPRLSWLLSASQRGARQAAYQIVVDSGAGGPTLWDTGKVQSRQSVQVIYAGPRLQSGQRCRWRVRVWDAGDQSSDWSEPAFWEMGLVEADGWRARWITPDTGDETSDPQAAPLLRKAFALDGHGQAIQAARIYVTSLGLYELHLNGQRVGDGLLTPGWTSYARRLQYQTYDVTALVHSGNNAIGAILADGWYCGHLGFEGKRGLYGQRRALLLQLHVTYADGRTTLITSDEGWRAGSGPIRMADLYHGETYDARMAHDRWAEAGFDDSAWGQVHMLDHPKDTLVAQVGPFVKRQEQIKPVRILHSPKGETIFDFGQNMVGWVRLRVRGEAGKTVTLHHAEVLDQDGNFYTANLRTAKQTVEYTLRGGGNEVYEPRFTFMGFQFVQVEGYPGELTLDSLTGIVVHSDISSIGTFECDNRLINQLQHNIVWGQKGNFVDVPTDCPQRDERLGWTGDAQVFVRTACFNRDVATFFTKWLRDLAADQKPSGSVPFVVPDVLSGGGMGESAGSAAWSDAAIICPWTIYLSYGDTRILETQYDSMAAWVRYMREQAGERLVWLNGFHFGDWLDFRGQPLMPSPVTNRELIATAFLAYDAALMVDIARILGKTEDAQMYAKLAAEAKAAFNAEFVAPNGRVGPGSQTAYVLALHFDLLPEKLRAQAAERLAGEIRKADYHLTTGFVGTPYLCHVLSRFGQTALAYELLNQETFPSWLYPVKKGATTIWERWDGIKPDGSFQDVGMNSFNHYAYGAIGEWLYRVVAGIEADPEAPGYQHTLIQPQPGGGLTHVRATLDSPYGEVTSEWELRDSDLRLRVRVPANAHATVRIPAVKLSQVTESQQPLRRAPGISSVKVKGGVAIIEIGSGEYEFVTTGLNLPYVMAGVRHVAGRLDRTSPLSELKANERGRAALEAHVGEALEKIPRPPWMRDTSLEQLARFAPDKLTEERLRAIERDIRAA